MACKSPEAKERAREYVRAWRARNTELSKAINRRWNEANKIRWHAALAQNHWRVKAATPPWADRKAMIDMYECAKVMSRETGRPYEIDHIVPIKGKDVCGLHVPWNIQIIERLENKKKGNKLLLDV